MNTVLVFQPEDVARLLEIERESRELSARLEEIASERESILMKAVRTEYEESEVPDFSMFGGTTSLLLTKFYQAENKMLFPDDIWQDVMFRSPDEEDENGGVRVTVRRARRELEASDCGYEIKNIRGQGYQLVRKEMGQRGATCKKTP